MNNDKKYRGCINYSTFMAYDHKKYWERDKRYRRTYKICFLLFRPEARRMLARRMAFAGDFPLEITSRRALRSASLSSMMYFTDGIYSLMSHIRYMEIKQTVMQSLFFESAGIFLCVNAFPVRRCPREGCWNSLQLHL